MKLERDEFMILSVPWEVREVPGGSSEIDELCGKADFNNYVIFICADMPYQERLETLVHEIFHIHSRGLDKVDLTNEDTLRVFSMMVCDTLLRNSLSFDLKNDQGW